MIRKTSIREGEWRQGRHGARFEMKGRSLTGADNKSGLGCAVYRVAPGKHSFPRHAHLANDEAIYIIDGMGTLIAGDERIEMSAGDFALIPRGREHAHTMQNRGSAELVYLCMSTMNAPDVIQYPDSGKLGVQVETFPDRAKTGTLNGFYERRDLGYWQGEPED
jgi:uncharacterized cupin superfamily protein